MVSAQLHRIFETSAVAEIDRSHSLADGMCFADLRVLGIRKNGDEAAAQRSAAVTTQLDLPPWSLFHRFQERLGLSLPAQMV